MPTFDPDDNVFEMWPKMIVELYETGHWVTATFMALIPIVFVVCAVLALFEIPRLKRRWRENQPKLARQHPVQLRAARRAQLLSILAIGPVMMMFLVEWPWFVAWAGVILLVGLSLLCARRVMKMQKARERGDCPNCYYEIMAGQTVCSECGLDLEEKVGDAGARRMVARGLAYFALFMIVMFGVQMAPMVFGWGRFNSDRSSYGIHGPGIDFTGRWVAVMEARYPPASQGGDGDLRTRMWVEMKASIADDLARLTAEADALYGADYDLAAIDRHIHEGLLECNEKWREHWTWYEAHLATTNAD